MNTRQLFLQHVAQTSPAPIGLEIVKASGIHMWDRNGKAYIDLISGFSVCNIGHGHPAVKEAVRKQVDEYMHLIVYGEFIEAPQVAYAQALTQQLPASLNCVYFTNSGAEATEGAMKLAKRATGKSKMIACNKAYHGSTQGALSLIGSEYWRNAFRPLLPDIEHYDFNSNQLIDAIDDDTACVIMETVQAESGIHKPDSAWITAVQQRCREKGALLILDEIQAGFGRTGSLWAFEQYGIIPDILLLGKALGGGMPLGAFIADRELMQLLTTDPVLGHITTFGGHPVSCAAGLAAFQILTPALISSVAEKEALFCSLLQKIKHTKFRSAGLWFALEFADENSCQRAVHSCVANGLVTDWFLFAPNCLRIAPPLIITLEEIRIVCAALEKAVQ